MRRVFVLLLAVVLAGCGQGNDGKQDTLSLADGTKVDFDDAGAFTDTTGAIRGVVVDEAIRPLGGVNVTLQPANVTATTDVGGIFAFDRLEPGVYFLNVPTRPGYLSAQSSADVIAGEATTVRMVLFSDGAPTPYHYTLTFDWFDSSGVAIVDFAIDLTDETFLGDTLPPACDRCYFDFDADMPAASMILEGTWDVTVANPAGDVDWYWNVEDRSDGGSYEHDYCSEPCYVDVPLEDIGNSTLYRLTMSSDERWITYNQQATLYVTLFYHAKAPEGWSLVAGDT